jgi:predicted esterase
MKTTKLQLEIGRIHEIPVLTISPSDASGCPVVFFLHALGGKKEDALELGFLLAQQNIFCVAFDAKMHGERFDPRLDDVSRAENALYPPESRLDEFQLMMREIVPGNHHDAEAILDKLTNDPRVDCSRVGVTGVSMGGISTYYMAAHSSKIKAAAPIIAWPDFEERWKEVELECYSNLDWVEKMDLARPVSNDFLDWMQSVDPLPRLGSYVPNSLFIQLGELDPHVSKSTALRLYHHLKKNYAMHSGRLCIKIYEGVNHRTTPEMFVDNASWFKQQLL